MKTRTGTRAAAALAICGALLVPGVALAADPTVETLPADATLLTDSYALLSGNLNPNGTDVVYRFEWGRTATYGHTTPTTSAGNGKADVPVDISLDTLKPNTTYHYRLVAQNDHGTTRTPDASFTTNPAPSPPGDTTAPRISKVKIHWPRIKFALDEPATVTFTIGKRHWTRKLKAGTFTVKAPAKVRRAVKRGRHTLRVVAIDDAGNRATVLRKRFRR